MKSIHPGQQLHAWCRWLSGVVFGLLLGVTPPAFAQLAVPALSAHVMDTTGTLSAPQVQALEGSVDQTFKLISGEALPAPGAESKGGKTGFKWMDLLIFAFIAVPVVAGMARSILGPRRTDPGAGRSVSTADTAFPAGGGRDPPE